MTKTVYIYKFPQALITNLLTVLQANASIDLLGKQKAVASQNGGPNDGGTGDHNIIVFF